MPETKDQNLTDLGDFFSLISSGKKKKEEEYKSLIGDLGSVLSELDEVSKTKIKKVKKKNKPIEKKIKKETKNIEEPKIDVNNLFEELAILKKKEEEKRKKEQKEIKAFESWLFTEPSEIKEEIVETHEEPEEVVLEEEPAIVEEPEESEQVVEQEEISEEVEEEPEEEENTTVSQVLEALKTIIRDENIVEEKNNEIDTLKKEIKDLRNLLYQGLRDISAQGGGGEVRLEFLDDIDRDSAKINNKFLKYEAASNKWVGAAAADESGSEDLDTTLHLGNTSNVGMSVGVVTTTELMVTGDAKVVGVLTVGSSSLTLDGDVNTVQVGAALTLGHDIGVQFHEQFLHINGFDVNNVKATGVITATSFSGSMDFGEFI